MTNLRTPPQNINAEKCLLGSEFIDARKIDVVRDIVSPRDFHCDVHSKIQTAIMKMRDAGSELDVITIAAQLEAFGTLEDVGGMHYLMEVIESVPHAENAVYYAKIVAACARRRSAIAIAQRLIERAHDMTADETEATEAAIEAATSLAENRSAVTSMRTMQEHVTDLLTSLEAGVPMSQKVLIPEIDELIGGSCPGEMIIIGARPSHGKSLVALQCLDCAASHGLPGLIVSEEMSAMMLANRSLQSITTIPAEQWMSETSRLRFDAREHFAERAPVLVAEKCGSVAAAERAIARAVQMHDVKVVAVDYAQMLRGVGDSEQERIADVSQRMKAAAVRHSVVMLLLAQLNRGIESRENAEPGLADLRGSGSLEQDGDVIIFPFWPWKLDQSYGNKFEYRIYQRKNRNRGIGSPLIQMRINPERQRIVSDTPQTDLSHAENF